MSINHGGKEAEQIISPLKVFIFVSVRSYGFMYMAGEKGKRT